MKKFFTAIAILAIFANTTAVSQEIKPKFEKEGELIKGTYYYENGSIRQEGTYKNGQLHGEWVSYDQDGKKNAVAQYKEGVKTGKWFFWNKNFLTEVDYNNNIIAEVHSYEEVSGIVEID
ncbi:nicotinic acid mononucleotide adenyltransferase [Antarcticibacterium sp. 1MA-6-2]|uniref:toxin-antitoxin system YwqK family antitoxin n=1 Tax=Antarcticibacterium sp. 1MA-6-2 TaxID=2908210 RepID=UPI001F468379|nr:nicotinic acid mononucleotide adenyltransferase [Antarcticibacterium sp. 1MA-6-2]UJH90501.1 nicotinic acid mononucleotide adenyltransferase [Antarcticibacterium sp. 1MA-6-2]